MNVRDRCAPAHGFRAGRRSSVAAAVAFGLQQQRSRSHSMEYARIRLLDRRSALRRLGETLELAEVDAALARIDAGSYGVCEGCGHSVGRSRLIALPETRLCIGCSDAAGSGVSP
jgi:DnaK suppressor protein